MLKITFYILTLTIVIASCRRSNGYSKANDICSCYDSIHDESVRSDNQEDTEAKVKSCNLLFTSALDSFEEDEEKVASFMKSYRECQKK